MIINGYKAVNLDTGEVIFAPTLLTLSDNTLLSTSTIRRALQRNGECRRNGSLGGTFLISTCKYDYTPIDDSKWLMNKLDGVNWCEVVEITGDKTFIIHGRYKEIAINHYLAKKDVIADYINKHGTRTLVVLRGDEKC